MSILLTTTAVALAIVPLIIAFTVAARPERMLTTFIVLLPIHSLAITLLYRYGEFTIPQMKAISAWK
jgi:hypothetical protein